MTRVIQSVDRLIRTETDRGVAVLICNRFSQRQYSSLFPQDWYADEPEELITKDVEGELKTFLNFVLPVLPA